MSTLRKSISIHGRIYEIDIEKIPAEILNELRIAFDHLDQDKSGKIGIDEFQEYLYDNGTSMTVEEIKENFFDDNDVNNDFELDFYEFAARMAPRTEIIIDKVIEAFRNFAGKNSKYIDPWQLKHILMNLGNDRFTEEEVKEIFEHVEIAMGKPLQYENFVQDWREKANIQD